MGTAVGALYTVAHRKRKSPRAGPQGLVRVAPAPHLTRDGTRRRCLSQFIDWRGRGGSRKPEGKTQGQADPRMRLISATCLALSALSPNLSQAEAKLPIVVELFTSQGCSSCPPADAMLHDLSRMDGVIALALHVDYWDYIGWPDSFASPHHTARQEAYARANGERMVYTPQIIVGGQDRVVGGDAMAVMERLHAHADATTPVELSLRQDGDRLVIEAPALPLPRPLDVQVVRYVPEDEVVITGGENAGLTMAYSNIVTSWDKVGAWTGAEPLDLSLPLEGTEPVVVLLQEAGPGRIRAAATLDP